MSVHLEDLGVERNGLRVEPEPPQTIDLTDAAATINVIVAHSHALFRDAIRAAMESEESLEVVGVAGSGKDAYEQARTHQPDVALLYRALADVDVLEMVGEVKDLVPNCKVVVLAADPGEEELVNVLEAGADGYITSEAALGELLESVRAVHKGEVTIPRAMVGGLLARIMNRRKSQERAFRLVWDLTGREREVLALLAEGEDNEGIGAALVISPQTARTHVQNLLGKLGVHSRLEAAAFVAQNNLLHELRAES